MHTAAVASEEAFYTRASGEPLVRYPTADAAGCDAKQVEVKTFDENLQLSNQIAFTVKRAVAEESERGAAARPPFWLPHLERVLSPPSAPSRVVFQTCMSR
jgi:hypothetical protein